MTNRTIFVYTTVYSSTGGGQYAMTLLAERLHARGYELVFFTRPPFRRDHRYVRRSSGLGLPIHVFQRYGDTWWGKCLLVLLTPLMILSYMLLRRCGFRTARVAANSILRTRLVQREERDALRTMTRRLRDARSRGRQVVLHLWSPAGLAPLLLQWANRESVPAIFHEMGEADEPYFKTWQLGPSAAELHRASVVVCSCPTVASNIKRVYDYYGDVAAIPFPVADPDDSFENGQKRCGRFTIGIIGRLVPHKRHADLMAAVEALVRSGRDVGLVIAGDGPLRLPLEAEVARLGLADRVSFTGEFERLEDVMSRFDVFAITSSSESQCMPVLESGAYAKPVLVSDHGGMPDFVEHGVTGLIVPLGDTGALVAALQRLFDEPELRVRMGLAGRRRYEERYTPERIADMHERVYDRALADRPAEGLNLVYVVEHLATFIINEISWLRQLGSRVTLASAFRLPTEADPVKERYRRESLYFPPRYRGVLVANLRCLLRRPVAYVRAFRLVRRERESFRILLLAGYYTRRLAAENVQHFHSTFGTRTTLLAHLIARLSGRSYSFTTHAYDIYRPNPSLVWKTNGAAFMRTISEFNRRFVLEAYPGTDPDKIRVVYLGVDPKRFAPRPRPPLDPTRVRIVAVGSLIEQKGHVFLVRACRLLVDRGYGVYCQIIGEGDKRVVVEKEIARLALGGQVTLSGELPYDTIQQHLSNADVFALPCIDLRGKGEHVDGIPVAIMEAMALGLPVVSTTLSGIPELVENGVSGLLVPEKDEHALADALARLIGNADLRDALGRAARERIEERFDLKVNVAALAGLFREAE